ncbi:MAG TPA: hypothetical protein VJY33_05685 [Isosphaeraceae bacterium]|nr:hypothetical protein [Isosphaeraceae bacterium]
MKAKDFFAKVEKMKARLTMADMDKPVTFWLTNAAQYANDIDAGCPPVEMRDIHVAGVTDTSVDLYIDW